jgi:hypothetical protein
MSQWDSESLSRRFLSAALAAESYLNEIRPRIREQPNYAHLYDSHLAEFWLTNYLHGKVFLDSRSSLIAELRGLLERPIDAPEEAMDKQRFITSWRNCIQRLLTEFSGSHEE